MRAPAPLPPLVVAIALAACATKVALPEREPDVRGVVTAVTPADAGETGGERLGTLRIEENPADASGSAKWVLTITGNTIVLVRPGEVTEPASFERLVIGQRVDAWVTGPVRESYPMQADASHVLVRDSVGTAVGDRQHPDSR